MVKPSFFGYVRYAAIQHHHGFLNIQPMTSHLGSQIFRWLVLSKLRKYCGSGWNFQSTADGRIPAVPNELRRRSILFCSMAPKRKEKQEKGWKTILCLPFAKETAIDQVVAVSCNSFFFCSPRLALSQTHKNFRRIRTKLTPWCTTTKAQQPRLR